MSATANNRPPRERRRVRSPLTQTAAPLAAILAVLSLVVLGVSGAGWATVGTVAEDVASAENLNLGSTATHDEHTGKKLKPGQAADGAVDILLVGSDSRTDAQGNPLSQQEIDMLRAGDEATDNTDTIMLIRVPNDGSSATAISIPRDTYVHDSFLGNVKINGIYALYKMYKREELVNKGISDEKELETRSKEAGRKALINAVNDLGGVTIDHYAEVGLLGFVLLTDAVGGVEVCLKAPVNDSFSHANFPAGRQTLNGADALSFVRQRHGLPRGDLDRITRQQAYMASLVNRVLSTKTLSNPAKVSSLVGAVKRSVIIDQGWDIVNFAGQLQNLAGGKVKFATIPVTSIDGVGDHGESVVTIDSDQVHHFFHTLLGDKDKLGSTNKDGTTTAAQSPKAETSAGKEKKTLGEPDTTVTVHIVNATTTGEQGFASRVALALADGGWITGEVNTARAGLYDKSQVLSGKADDPKATYLAKALGGLPVDVAPSLQPNELVVVAADDWDGPLAAKDELPPVNRGDVGQPGGPTEAITAPVINAGGDGPRCVN